MTLKDLELTGLARGRLKIIIRDYFKEENHIERYLDMTEELEVQWREINKSLDNESCDLSILERHKDDLLKRIKNVRHCGGRTYNILVSKLISFGFIEKKDRIEDIYDSICKQIVVTNNSYEKLKKQEEQENEKSQFRFVLKGRLLALKDIKDEIEESGILK